MIEYKPKNILITGGLNYIGINLVEYLLNKYKDITIVNLDNICSDTDTKKNTELLNNYSNYNFVKSTILNSELLEYIFYSFNIETVIHLYTLTKTDYNVHLTSINEYGTHSLLDLSLKYKVLKFVFLSTLNITENSIDDIYSVSMMNCENIIRHYQKKFNFPSVVVRVGDVIGKNNSMIIDKCVNDNFENYSQYYNFKMIYIEDLIEILNLIILYSDKNIYNLEYYDINQIKDVFLSIKIKEPINLKKIEILGYNYSSIENILKKFLNI